MPNLPASNPSQFIQGAPVLQVPDVEASARFYRDMLGFTWDFGNADYAVVWRDNSAVHFVKGDGAPEGVSLFQWVRDVDAYYEEVAARVGFDTERPVNQPYGIRQFGIRDLNGAQLIFGQDIEPE